MTTMGCGGVAWQIRGKRNEQGERKQREREKSVVVQPAILPDGSRVDGRSCGNRKGGDAGEPLSVQDGRSGFGLRRSKRRKDGGNEETKIGRRNKNRQRR